MDRMRALITFAAAAVIGAVGSLAAAPAGAGDGVTWMRGHVQQRQMARMQRYLARQPGGPGIKPSIIGGNVAAAGKWPFQVALLDATVGNNYNAQFCGGSLIGRRHVLTAAHCVDFLTNASELHVLTGTRSLASGGTRRAVAAFRFHPRWNEATSDFDIAVVTLQNPVSGIRPVRLLERNWERHLASAGDLAYVTGWGDTSGNSSFPTLLHEVRVPIVAHAICNAPASYDGDITARMICAGLKAGGKDSCQGDSGGPLTVRNNAGQWLIQAGIVSWGIGCALPNLYGVYTRLAVLSAWALAVANSASPVSQAESCDGQRGAAQADCFNRAIVSVAVETKAYLDQLKRDGTRGQRDALDAEQRTWSMSLASRCAFDATVHGAMGRMDCRLRELRSRADALAKRLSDGGS